MNTSEELNLQMIQVALCDAAQFLENSGNAMLLHHILVSALLGAVFQVIA